MLVGLAAECAGLEPEVALRMLRGLPPGNDLLVAEVASGIRDSQAVGLLAELGRSRSHLVRWAVNALVHHDGDAVADPPRPTPRYTGQFASNSGSSSKQVNWAPAAAAAGGVTIAGILWWALKPAAVICGPLAPACALAF